MLPFIGNGSVTQAVDIADQRSNTKLKVLNTYAKIDALDLQYLETYASVAYWNSGGPNIQDF